MNKRRDLSRFVGIPYRLGRAGFDGADCYGLVRLFHREEMGQILPDHPGQEIATDHPEVMRAQAGRGPWRRVDEGTIGDVAVMPGARGLHCGVLIDRTRFLHVTAMAWSEFAMVGHYPLIGIYRWQS